MGRNTKLGIFDIELEEVEHQHKHKVSSSVAVSALQERLAVTTALWSDKSSPRRAKTKIKRGLFSLSSFSLFYFILDALINEYTL
ncbi:hypothetical protein SAMN05444673_6817 [Bacillus sp. OV166]|uniref:hypothetical protein n=1 Tax=Bacillus sp. OV166 TaxID=1882763 RepID=UPI000A2AEC34|nr:hypothetical protein [Bacillus sp. OV166]SMQ86772.1 hypothetical protein SAMN05444673_6817 [Bacillus sp. OV166]